jgi:hypothetical protein
MPSVSPDGRHLLWLQRGFLEATHIRVKDWDSETSRDLPSLPLSGEPSWVGDNRHVVVQAVVQKHIVHLFSLDTATPDAAPVDLTPLAGRLAIRLVSNDANGQGDGTVLVAIGREEKSSVDDLYRISTKDETSQRVEQGTPALLQWLAAADGRLAARLVRDEAEPGVRLELRHPEGTWEPGPLLDDRFSLYGLSTLEFVTTPASEGTA